MTFKVDNKEFSIEEMKTAADDIKKLRPIQEAILVALKLRAWEEIPDVLKLEVTASRLARFMVNTPLFTLSYLVIRDSIGLKGLSVLFRTHFTSRLILLQIKG